VARALPTKSSAGLGAWRRFRRSPGALAGLLFVGLMLVVAYAAPLIANDRPLAIRYQGVWSFPAFRGLFPFNRLLSPDPVSLHLQRDPDWLLDARIRPDPQVGHCLLPPIPYSPYRTRLDDVNAPPSWGTGHYFGCDDSGRDVASRLVHGTKVSVLVGLLAVAVALAVGVTVGGAAGYAGGWLDTVLLSRLMEVMACFPTFFLLLTVVAVMDPKYLNIWSILLVIGLTSWTDMARYARAEFLRLKSADFVAASRALGSGPLGIAARHLLPNAMAPLLVSASFGVAGVIFFEAALSFLGVGIQPPEPSWGNVLALVTRYWNEWWLGLFPGAAIFLAVLSYNRIGEGLRDALDPKSRD
jgi:peptide/nickel transport system permease protein